MGRLREWFNGRMPVFQTGDAGSIPVSRSNSTNNYLQSIPFSIFSKISLAVGEITADSTIVLILMQVEHESTSR